MGTWGAGVLSNDFGLDVYGDYIDRFNAKKPHAVIVRELKASFKPDMTDDDDGPPFWLAVAKAQWECGALDPKVLKLVESLITSGKAAAPFAEGGAKLLAKRKAVLERFLEGLKTVNPKPQVPRKGIKRKPIFEPGDCLALRLKNGKYTAILVLKHPPDTSKPHEDTYGVNLVAHLKYLSSRMPRLGDFEMRKWRADRDNLEDPKRATRWVIAWGFRKVKEKLIIVGRIAIRKDDPAESSGHTSWANLVEGIEYRLCR